MKDVFVTAAFGLCISAVPVFFWLVLRKRQGRLADIALNIAVSCGTFTVIFSGIALFWQGASGRLPERMQAVMPEALKRKNITGSRDYYWLGHLHRFNSLGFRGLDFPEKKPSVFRIIVLGDSLTYGEGVAEAAAYPLVLQGMLADTYRVEVLNLGVCGNQMRDTLELFEKFAGRLAPDLVLYGFCLNDFLPPGVGQYQADQWRIPLPESFKGWLESRVSIVNYCARKYDELLRRYHVRRDFFDDIILSLEENSSLCRNFSLDARKMNALSRAVCGQDVIAAVLDQYPGDPRGRPVGEQAAAIMKKAGMQVVDHRAYFTGKEHEQFHVSKWEGHPNETCHRIFAHMLYDRIMQLHEAGLRKFTVRRPQ